MNKNNYNINCVKHLQKVQFNQLTLQEKLAIKQAGRPKPILQIIQTGKSRQKEYFRRFNPDIYERCQWICGCEHDNALFCFPCLLFGDKDVDIAWTKTGQTDLKRLPDRIKTHQSSAKHINHAIDLCLLGQTNITDGVNTPYELVACHNEEVHKNRATLSKIINCVKFCG